MTNLNSLKEIKLAIEKLTPQECDYLREWFDQYNHPQPIDLQLSADFEAGKLDDRIRRAVADHDTGRTRPI